MVSYEELGRRIRERRRSLALSQESLVERAGVSKETIHTPRMSGATFTQSPTPIECPIRT